MRRTAGVLFGRSALGVRDLWMLGWEVVAWLSAVNTTEYCWVRGASVAGQLISVLHVVQELLLAWPVLCRVC